MDGWTAQCLAPRVESLHSSKRRVSLFVGSPASHPRKLFRHLSRTSSPKKLMTLPSPVDGRKCPKGG